ncbi:MAG: vitamin K epoxide reductase family protein [Gemmatimonadaceae bacterium]|nr:vitamin K epoxide reductase family protein [Gemmatimonadaceae bacterium]
MVRRLVALLALAGIFLATYLALYKFGMIGALTCTVGSCETVQLSKWAMFLGLPVAAWGVGFYIAVFVLAMLSLGPAGDSPLIGWALLLITGWGVLFSAWLTYLELYVIHAICMWCVVSAVLTTIIFVLVALDKPWRVDPAPIDEAG